MLKSVEISRKLYPYLKGPIGAPAFLAEEMLMHEEFRELKLEKTGLQVQSALKTDVLKGK